MSEHKRKASPPPSNVVAVSKRARPSSPPSNQMAISSGADASKALLRSVPRTSGLDAEVLSCRVDPTGQNVAACSADRLVSLWRTSADNELRAHHVPPQRRHTRPVVVVVLAAQLHRVLGQDGQLHGRDDRPARARKLRGHRGIINAVDRALSAGRSRLQWRAMTGVKVWEGGTEDEKGGGGGALLPRCAGVRAGLPSMLAHWTMRFTSLTSAIHPACTPSKRTRARGRPSRSSFRLLPSLALLLIHNAHPRHAPLLSIPDARVSDAHRRACGIRGHPAWTCLES